MVYVLSILVAAVGVLCVARTRAFGTFVFQTVPIEDFVSSAEQSATKNLLSDVADSRLTNMSLFDFFSADIRPSLLRLFVCRPFPRVLCWIEFGSVIHGQIVFHPLLEGLS